MGLLRNRSQGTPAMAALRSGVEILEARFDYRDLFIDLTERQAEVKKSPAYP
jgi:hypothetical protein